MQLGCGCTITAAGEQLTSACKVGHQPSAPAKKKSALTKPPAAAATVEDRGAVETERKAKKRAETRDSGRKLAPGRYRWSPATGECEAVKVDEVSAEAGKP
jgi:hypothetical protein